MFTKFNDPFFGVSIFDFNPNTKRGREIINDLQLTADYFELFEMVVGMFKYNGLPWRKEFIEDLLLRYGWAAIGKDDNGVHVGYISYNELDENNIPIGPATLVTRHGYEMQGEIDKNIVLGFNNDIRLPELKLEFYANLFNETDISIKSIIQKARLNPVPLARDSKVEKALNDLMGEIKAGNTKAIGYDGLRDDLVEGAEPVTMLHLTEPEHTDKLQYMSKFYDDLLRRVLTFYGHPLSSASKMAQVTSAELEGYTTYSRIYPNILLDARKDFMDRCNDILDTNFTVEFSKAWEHLNNDIILNNEEVAEDEIEENVETTEGSESGSESN